MAGFSKSSPGSKALLFLAAVALFSCGLMAGLARTSTGPKNLRAADQIQQQQQQQPQQQPQQQREDEHSGGLLRPMHSRPKLTNLASLHSIDNGNHEENKPDAFVWPGNFAYETFHAMDEMDTLVGGLPELSALDFATSFSFSYDYDDDAWAA